jgi:hypothetical protein
MSRLLCQPELLRRPSLTPRPVKIGSQAQSPNTESNRRPSPYHGDALPTELLGPCSTSRAETDYTGPTPPEKSASRSTIAIPAWQPQFTHGELPALLRVHRLVPFHRIPGQRPLDRLYRIGGQHRLGRIGGVGPFDRLSGVGGLGPLGRQRRVADVGGKRRGRHGHSDRALASYRDRRRPGHPGGGCGGQRPPNVRTPDRSRGS